MSSEHKIHDVVMIGAGPASLTAAIYTTREELDTVVIEKGVVGGMTAATDVIENYPGFPEGVSGLEFADKLRAQAEKFGTKIELNEVTNITVRADKIKELETTDGVILAKAVLISTGSDYKKLGVPGEQKYYARGVHYCATCDGAFYRGKRLVVVGGGNSAVQEAMFLTRFASHIDLLVRSKLRASEILQRELSEKYADKITVHLGIATDEISGNENGVNRVTGTDVISGKKVDFETDGVFVFVGLNPNTSFLRSSGLEFDDSGFIKTDSNLETILPGVFAAGDVRADAIRQVATAVGEGATAAIRIREYLESCTHNCDEEA